VGIVVATEPYLLSRRASVMAAKLLSMKLGVQLKLVDSDWLVRAGFEPYVPSFLAELEGGALVRMRTEESLDHKEMASLLESDLNAVFTSKHQDHGS